MPAAVCHLSFVIAPQALAAFPQQTNYQGKLTNAGNIPLTGSYSIVFTIYDAASGGTSKWTETQTVTTESGFFNVILGSVTAIGTADVFDGTDRWLGIKVGADAEMTPRQKLTSVGHAFHAYNADKLDGQEGSYYAPASGGNYVLKAGDSMTGTLTNSAGANFATSSGNVGIGTASPSYLLHIIKNQNAGTLAFVTNTQDGTDSFTGFQFQSDNNEGGSARSAYFRLYSESLTLIPNVAGKAVFGSSNVPELVLSADKGSTTGTEAITFRLGSAQTEYMRVNEGGNVGINTPSPTRTLEVTGIVKATNFEGDGSSLTGVATSGALSAYVLKAGDIMTGNLTMSAATIYAANGSLGAPGISFANDTDSGIYLTTPGNWRMATNGSALLEMDASGVYVGGSGNLGSGGGVTLNLLSFQADGADKVAVSQNTFYDFATAGAKLFSWRNHSVEKAYIDKDGAIVSSAWIKGTSLESTVATGTPPLTVASTTKVTNLNADLLDDHDTAYFATASSLGDYVLKAGDSMTGTMSIDAGVSDPALRIRTDSNTREALYVNKAGNVGIGTTSPQKKLDVQGSGGNGIRVSNSTNPAYYADLLLNYNDVTTLQLALQGTAILQAGSTNDTVIASRGTNKDIVLTPNGTGETILNGNVGIGTASPGQKLSVAGTIEMTSGSGGGIKFPDATIQTTAATPGSYVLKAGDSMTGTLTVEGQCVTGDTLLPIVSNVKCQMSNLPAGRQGVKFKQIKDVQPGDYVLSLNEKTGKIEPHRIKGLLDMGVKPVFKLTTATGRSIKTTGNHPYLTRKGWKKVVELSEGQEIAALKESISPTANRNFGDQNMSVLPVKNNPIISNPETVNLAAFPLNGNSEMKRASCRNIISDLLDDASLDVGRELAQFPIGVSGKTVTDHLIPSRRSISFAETLPDFLDASISSQKPGLEYSKYSMKSIHALLSKTTANILPFLSTNRTIPSNGKGSFAVLDGPSKTIFSSTKSFNKVGTISTPPEMKFTTPGSFLSRVLFLQQPAGAAAPSTLLGASDILWDKIVSIEYVGCEQVYDIEVEGTHNFVANNIIAHNTHLSGLVGIGTASPGQKLSVAGTIEMTSGSGGGIKFPDATIQTTAATPGNYVLKAGDSMTGTLTNSAISALATNSLTLKGSIADGTNAKGVIVTNSNSFANSSARLMSWQNGNTEEAYIGRLGNLMVGAAEEDHAAIGFIGDTDTGITHPSTGVIGFLHEGSGSGTITSGGLIFDNLTSTGLTLTITGGQTSDFNEAVGINLKTPITYATEGAKLLSISNNTTEKASIDKNGTIKSSGGHIVKHKAVTTTPYTALSSDYIIGVSIQSAATIYLPTSQVTVEGRVYVIKDELLGAPASYNMPITIVGEAGEKIDNVAAGYAMAASGESIAVYSDGVNQWFTFGKSDGSAHP